MNNETISYYCEQFRSIMSGQPWYGRSVENVIENIDHIQAFRTQGESSHSIVQIVHHMCTWKTYLIEKLKSNRSYRIAVNGPEDWIVIADATEQEWEAAKQRLRETNDNLLQILGTFSDEQLKMPVPKEPQDPSFTYQHLIDGVIQHDVYHVGQIALLRNLKGLNP